MNGFVANDREFMSTGHYENQHGVALVRIVHTEPMKLSLRRNQWIGLQFAALNKNANLTGSISLGFTNRLHDAVVVDFAKKFSCSHLLPTAARTAAAETAPTAAKPTETSTASGRPASTSTTHRQKYRTASAR